MTGLVSLAEKVSRRRLFATAARAGAAIGLASSAGGLGSLIKALVDPIVAYAMPCGIDCNGQVHCDYTYSCCIGECSNCAIDECCCRRADVTCYFAVYTSGNCGCFCAAFFP